MSISIKQIALHPQLYIFASWSKIHIINREYEDNTQTRMLTLQVPPRILGGARCSFPAARFWTSSGHTRRAVNRQQNSDCLKLLREMRRDIAVDDYPMCILA